MVCIFFDKRITEGACPAKSGQPIQPDVVYSKKASMTHTSSRGQDFIGTEKTLIKMSKFFNIKPSIPLPPQNDLK